jgi:hypothetical protein
MADYYPLIARAVAGLDKSTGEARRALYERARTALVAQLRGVTPALSESDITRERLALEESIRKVEAEAAKRPRLDAPAEAPVPAPPPMAEPAPPESSHPSEHDRNEPPQSEPRPPERPQYQAPRPQMPPPEPARPEPAFRPEPVVPDRRGGNRPPEPRPSLSDQALRGFRDVVADNGDRGEAARQTPSQQAPPHKAAKPPRESLAAGPAPSAAERRREPRFEPEETEPPYRETPRRSQPGDEFEDPHEPRRVSRGLGGMAWKLTVLAILVAFGVAAAFLYRERASIAGLYQSMRGPATQASRDTTQSRPKISDRIGTGGQQDSAGPGSPPAAAVAQRVVLYEQQPNTNDRKQFIGSVIWRTEMVSPGPGQPPALAVKADVEIPERRLRMNWTMHRTTDQTPASHTIEIIFTTGPDFAPGGVADVAAVLMDQPEQTRGAPLAGLRVKVTNGFFLVGLSAVESDVKRNVQLLKERPWLDISMVYNDGNRALLALEKGVPGDRVFAEAFAAWKQ